jgi:hypothetical protein
VNARLKAIATLPISRPIYRRSDLLNFREDWIQVNRDLLEEWFLAGPAEDFDRFCRVQHEIECNRYDAFKETYRGP